jgi:hypothetical protein
VNGGNGGSGVVILVMDATTNPLASIGGGLTYSLVTANGKRTYTFTAGTGTVVF